MTDWQRVGPAGPFVDIVLRNPLSADSLDPLLGGPEELRLSGLIDTGADVTMVMGGVPGRLQLLQTDRIEILGARGALDQGASSWCAEFFADVEVAGLRVRLPVYEGGFREPQMLLGRDLLSHLRFEYDGPASRFRLRQP